MNAQTTDVLVIGAGPAGTVAASIVKKAGFNVRIVEKMKFPRFVIGESLLPRCMEALEEAGFLDAVKDAPSELFATEPAQVEQVLWFFYDSSHFDDLRRFFVMEQGAARAAPLATVSVQTCFKFAASR